MTDLKISSVFFLLSFGHGLMAFTFWLKAMAKWREVEHANSHEGRRYYFRRCRRQLLAAVFGAFYMVLAAMRGMAHAANWKDITTAPDVLFIVGCIISLLVNYTVGKYRYEWKELPGYIRSWWTQRKVFWY